MLPERRRVVVAALVGVAVLIAAFLAGRFSAPTKVEERIRVERVEVEKVVVQEKVRVETVTVEKKVEVVRRVFVERIKPDGTAERTTTEELATTTDAASSNQAATSTRTEQDRASVRVEDRSKTVEAVLAWLRLEAAVGLSGAELLRGVPKPVGSVEASLRLGHTPFWLGLRLATDTRADVLAGVEWK